MSGPNEHHWIFGNGCHISFPGGGAPVSDTTSSMSTGEGCAAYSDSAGNLLFYTDGSIVWDGSHAQVGSGLGGNSSSANSAIIVPPAGSGSNFHIFSMNTSSQGNNRSTPNRLPLQHTEVTVTGSVVTVGPTNPVPIPVHGVDWGATESLVATPHTDCSKYWVIAQNGRDEEAAWLAILIDGDGTPSASDVVTSPYGAPNPPSFVFGMQISPDGSMIADACSYHPQSNPSGWPNQNESSIHIFDFDRSTGIVSYHSRIHPFDGRHHPYGVEFTATKAHLYFSDYNGGTFRRHQIGAPFSTVPPSSCPPIYSNPGDYTGMLQTGPDGLIYAAIFNRGSLCSIANPDAPFTGTTTASRQADIGFVTIALDASSSPLQLDVGGGSRVQLGLTRFTRIADDCLEGRCREIRDETDDAINEDADNKANWLKPCGAEEDWEPQRSSCNPADLPEFDPFIAIKWGDSDCDCIESDDTEILTVTICNPYSNVTMSGMTIESLTVVDPNGNPPATLPDGTPSIQLVPRGPYCFGNIESCSCVSREFTLRLRGAVAGEYHIRARGICFDINIHKDEEACFEFHVCRD